MNKAIRPSKSPVDREAVNGSPSESSPQQRTTGVYVDVENLRADAQQIVKTLIDNWPPVAPAPGVLCLYVRADFVELWRLWATSQFRGLQIIVKGVQHFSTHASKNSADIAIATDAISDLLSGRVGHLAVLSDDSDFIALYASVRDQTLSSDPSSHRVPFLWVITDRNDTLSTTVQQYFPREAIHVVPVMDIPMSPLVANGGLPMEAMTPMSSVTPMSPTSPIVSAGSSPAPFVDGSPGTPESEDPRLMEDIARAIIQQIPVGQFKSIDCQHVIRRFWPDHRLATSSGPRFGTEFLKKVWPLLEQRGAKVANPGQTPRRYEMTEQIKKDLFAGS